MKPPSVRVIWTIFISTRTTNKYFVVERDYDFSHTVTVLRCRTLIIGPPGCTIFVRVASITLTALDGHRATTERTLCASGASLSQLLPSQRSRFARESEWYINDQRSALFNFSLQARLSGCAQPFVWLCQRYCHTVQPAVWHRVIGLLSLG